MPEADIKEAVRNRYGEIARSVRTSCSSCRGTTARRTKGPTGNPESPQHVAINAGFQISRLPGSSPSGTTPCPFMPPRSLPLRWQRPFRRANARCPARRF
jgi:hypothetical protein